MTRCDFKCGAVSAEGHAEKCQGRGVRKGKMQDDGGQDRTGRGNLGAVLEKTVYLIHAMISMLLYLCYESSECSVSLEYSVNYETRFQLDSASSSDSSSSTMRPIRSSGSWSAALPIARGEAVTRRRGGRPTAELDHQQVG